MSPRNSLLSTIRVRLGDLNEDLLFSQYVCRRLQCGMARKYYRRRALAEVADETNRPCLD